MNGSRFLLRILATSYPVHPHKPIRTSYMGLLPVLLEPSTTIPWLLLDCPRNRRLSVQIVFASTIANSLSVSILDFQSSIVALCQLEIGNCNSALMSVTLSAIIGLR